MKLHIEKKVMGSLSNEMGDGVLAYTSGVSPVAGALCTLLGDEARSDSASLYIITHPSTGLLTIAHVQGGFTVFAGHGRAYPTRAVYEVGHAAFLAAGSPLFPLVQSLDGMHQYTSHEYGCDTEAELAAVAAASPSDEERRLCSYIVYCLVHRRQLFIRLGDDERLQGDALRQSPRLRTLLNAISLLPSEMIPYASLAYSVESRDKGIQSLFGNTLIVCHHDDISQWGNANEEGILVDWTAKALRSVNARRASQSELERLDAVSPMIAHFMSGRQPSLDTVFTLISSIPSNIDRVLHKSHLDDNDRMILSTAKQCGRRSYRYAEVCSRMDTPADADDKKKPAGTNDRKKAKTSGKQGKTTPGKNPKAEKHTQHQPTIDRRWTERHGRKLYIGLAVVVLLLLGATFLKKCTPMGKSASSTVYVPSSDGGFVGKANDLLAHLVERGNSAPYDTIHPHSIHDLQRRYPGLRFSLPYGKDAAEGGRAADIRLTDIDATQIENNADLRFFHNSDVPSLLEKQRQRLGERIFRISFADSDELVIDRIELVPAMFKLALEKNPWTGTILAAENSLFPDATHCFLSWGKTVVPLPTSGEGHLSNGGGNVKVLKTDSKTHELTLARGGGIDYYRLYQAYKADTTTVCLQLDGKSGEEVYLEYLDGQRLRVKPVGLYCQTYGSGDAASVVRPLSSSEAGEVYRLDKSLKLIFSLSKGGDKLTEVVVSRRNPMLTLSTLVHSSEGESRYTIAPRLTDKFTQQVVSGLSATLRNTMATDTVQLSIDPLLSQQMEKELADYCHTLRKSGHFYSDDQWELSLTMMDMATGCVVGAPYYRSTDEGMDYDLTLGRKNPALMRRYVGSTFKPLVALAAVLTHPSLARLNTTGQCNLIESMRLSNGKTLSDRANFMGHTTKAWATKPEMRAFWNGCPSMTQFLAVSDDVYPVALVAKALGYGEPTGSPFVFAATDVKMATNDNFTWAGSKFIHQMDRLYSIPGMKDYLANDSVQMAYYTWNELHLAPDDRFGLDNVCPDPTLLYYDKFDHAGATLKTDLVPWVLGQGSNEWNSLKLAEAWTRMLTKQKVNASFVTPAGNRTFTNLAEGYSNEAWNSFLQSLRQAQSASPKLLTPMNNAVKKLCQDEHIADTLLLFAKTGTPDNYLREEWKRMEGGPLCVDMGLFCMALMPGSSFRAVQYGGKPTGLMCVVRVTRLVDRKKHPNIMPSGSENGISSASARNFLSNYPERLRRLYHLTKKYY